MNFLGLTSFTVEPIRCLTVLMITNVKEQKKFENFPNTNTLQPVKI